ncbi:restriction endonuclease subunit S [Polaribacter dokdonensis]|uniref:Type I restriction enzyme, S subunit n=1 Tax=Polaribacter dokdonensis DSW-5 TaxID=1300348 RepID=A0A0M9CGV6_9FLAO|nr:restriction endonuclease subunit S [Polaribacter dokdonensis]KOY51695.1 Type I restriction-modification system, S subunit [Polaribacter dokdonensis DSW-5]SEE05324.1 type I restriction enzyme, S subunit [Polaribacter dokdonensis DSW-5]
MGVENNIPKGWEVINLGELIDIYNHKRIPLSTKTRSKRKGDYPYYGASNIVDYIDDYIFDGEFLLISEDGENLNTRNTPIAFIAKGKFWVNNHAHITKGKSEHLTKYLELYFKKLNVSGFITGAVQPKLSKGNLVDIPILISKSTKEQKAIAKVLTAFDDKIALLQAQNKTLETMAQTIFKEWFGKYQIGDELPEGWRVDTLENVSNEITRGFTTKYVEKSNLINLNQKVNKGRYLEKQHFKYYADDTIVPENKFIKKHDILLNSLGQGTLGRVHFYTEETVNVVADQHISILRFEKELSFYIYQVLASKTGQFRLENEITGSTGMLMLNVGKVRNFEVIMPNKVLLQKFTDMVMPFYEKLAINNSQIQSLKKTRDTLLPKLMSGQVRVKNLNTITS